MTLVTGLATIAVHWYGGMTMYSGQEVCYPGFYVSVACLSSPVSA
jgi:hypothetical protein